MPSGGKRPGAGRPKGSTTKSKPATTAGGSQFDDPLAYLTAVARGEIAADALRITAAKAALPYTTPKARAPVVSPAPKQLRRRNEIGSATDAQAEWRRRSEEIRRTHKEKNQNGNG